MTILFTATPLFAQLPQITNGISYLTSAQNTDGTWQSGTALVETTAATVSVLDTLKILNQTAGSPYSSGVVWLQGQSPATVEYIAERVRALTLTDGSVNALIPARDTVKGAWGGYEGFDLNNLDTVFALQALKTGNYSDATVINGAIAYLTIGQNSDGGWGFYRGDDSSVFVTAIVSATLQQFPQVTAIVSAINKATDYILIHQNQDGGFGNSPSTVYETALAYASLAALSTDSTAMDGAINYINASQSPNGSWNDDPYSTALALKALHLWEQKPPPPPPPAEGGRITGTVIDSYTKVKIAGVSVVLESNQLVSTVTGSSGAFTLDDVPVGNQPVSFAKSGYASTSATANITEGSVVNLGTVSMVSAYSTGAIAGTVTDSSGRALAGVSISVTGSWSGSGVTGADGSYSFTFVTPGQVTISAAKSGYQTLTTSGTVFARTTLTFSPRLSTTPSQETTGTLIGRVVDDHWGVPIDHLPGEEGVTVRLSGGITVEPDPDNGGFFSIQGLQPNTYQVTVGMPGFTSKTFRVVIMPGVTIDLGTIRLSMSISEMNLIGKVTDAATGDPITGAEVTVVGTDLTSRTDFAGSYAITGISHPSEFTLRASATGYNDKSFIVGSAPWTHTINITLTRQVTSGSLTGTVVDASSGQPLNGVTLALVSDAGVTATTNSSGVFTFNALPAGAQQVVLALSGYVSRTLTTKITAGAASDAGRIPLSVSPMAAVVQGTVWDAVVNGPFAGVDIEVSGTGYWHVLSEWDGTYRVDNVNPGTVKVAATGGPKSGYFGASFTGILEPGGILIFNPSLSTTPPPGVLKGTVSDYNDNHPIQGATIKLTPTPAGVELAFSDPLGAFSIPGIPPGSYTATISAPGYWSQNVNVNIISAYLGETTIGVPLMRKVSSTTISGKVTDKATGDPIANAVVSITGTNLTTTSGADGSYSLSGITTLEFTILTSAEGYDSFNYRIKTTAYSYYTIDLNMGKSGTSTTRIYGSVLDMNNGQPIEGAEVAIVGTSKSARTGADGKYSLDGVNEMIMNLKASAPGYDGMYSPLSITAFGEYEVSFTLSKSRPSTVVINSLETDKPAYGGNEPVSITLVIENTGDAQVELTAEAQIEDQYGNVAGLVAHPGEPVILAPLETQTVTMQWNTGQNPPGPYQITLRLVDRVLGGLLAEGGKTISIESTASIDGLVPLISPKFINVGATETIGISAYMVNRSNTDATLSAQYEIRGPDGALLSDGTIGFSMATTDAFKTVQLTEFTSTFTQSGQYPVTVKVLSGNDILAQTADAIYVAPAIRIDPAKTLDPVTVVPDGDKDIRINIQLKGVEGQP